MSAGQKHVGLTRAEYELLFDAARLCSPSRSVAIKAARALVSYEDNPEIPEVQYAALDRREAEMILDYFRLASPARDLALKMVALVQEWEGESERLTTTAVADAQALLELCRSAHLLGDPPPRGSRGRTLGARGLEQRGWPA
jgi:hypothetical protein